MSKIHRIYIENNDHTKKTPSEINKLLVIDKNNSLFHRIANVLRVNIGEKIELFNEEYNILCELKSKNKNILEFHIIKIKDNKLINDNKNINNKFLIMSLIKSQNLDLTIEKAVELGLKNLILYKSERSIYSNLNIDRINRVIIEATEQSGRNDIMNIIYIKDIKDVIGFLKDKDNQIKLYYGSVEKKYKDNIDYLNKQKQSDYLSIIVGPEGGFSENEIDYFNNNKIIPINFVSNILRAETAAIVSTIYLLKNN